MSSIVLKGSTSGTVTLQPAATISPNVTFTLPSTDGSAGQVLATNGSGTLSFITNDGSASYQAANSAGSYANGAFAKANTLFVGTGTANVNALLTTFITNEVEGNASLSLTAEEIQIYQAQGPVRIYTAGEHHYNFTANGNLILPGNLYANSNVVHANTITANTISTVDVISSNTVIANNVVISGVLDVDGVVLQWHTPVPLTSKGDPGDVAGLIAIDNDKLYRCVANYTDGTTDIWRFINFTGGAWG